MPLASTTSNPGLEAASLGAGLLPATQRMSDTLSALSSQAHAQSLNPYVGLRLVGGRVRLG